jgi:CelD/BcsL family acetyltransferase involved in cellulose biosynthesis
MSLRVRRIDRARDFMAVAPLWARLARESGQMSPFLSYDWFWCCWHGVWPYRRPEILIVEEAEVPVAIIPLMHRRERLSGLPVRYLGFLEYLNAPMVDLLTVAEHGLVLGTFLDHLISRSDWDIVWLQKLPVTSPTVKALEETLSPPLRWRRAGHLFSPYLTIAGTWESFYAAKSQDLREIQERLERAGHLSLEEHRTMDPRSPLFREMIELMRRRAMRDGKVANAILPRLAKFYSELTRRASKNGWLSLWLLRLDGQAIAMEYQLRANGKVQALWADGDPACRELLPGSALHLAIFKSLFERSCVREYSIGPGVKDDRLWWLTGRHEMVHLKLYRPGLYSRLLYRLETACE